MTLTDLMKSFFKIADQAPKTPYVVYKQKPQWIRITKPDGLRVVIPVHTCNIIAIEEICEKAIQTDPDYDTNSVMITLTTGDRYRLEHSIESVMQQLGLRFGMEPY